MTAILPPYTGETARCVKCGHQGAVVGYTPDGEACGRLSRLQAVDTVERLCRSCERCGYHWDEATVDAEKLAAIPCCCVCGTTNHGGAAFYENHRGQLFCWPCADGDKPKAVHPERICHLVHDHDGHAPHTWTDVDGNWLSCPGSIDAFQEPLIVSGPDSVTLTEAVLQGDL